MQSIGDRGCAAVAVKPFSCQSGVSLREREAAAAAGSDGRGGLGLFGTDAAHVLQLTRVGHVVAGFVLGQDLHQRAELQPPLLLRDPVAERRKREGERSYYKKCSADVI